VQSMEEVAASVDGCEELIVKSTPHSRLELSNIIEQFVNVLTISEQYILLGRIQSWLHMQSLRKITLSQIRVQEASKTCGSLAH